MSIVVPPVLFEGEAKAVIELATVHRLTEINPAFLDQLMDNIGAVFNTVERRGSSGRMAIDIAGRTPDLSIILVDMMTWTDTG